MVKIAFLILSESWSGAEKALFNILKKSETKDKIFLITNNEIAFNYKELKNIKLLNLGNYFSKPFYTKPFSLFFMRKKLKKILTSLELNLLITFLSHSLVLIYRTNDCPKIVTLRGEEIYNFLNKFKPHNKFFLYNALNNSNNIISVSNWQIKNLPYEYKKKTIVIPNGIDSNVFKPIKNIKQRKNVVLFTGRFIDIKGIREILSVAKQLPQYEFWFAGQGPLVNLINLPNTKNLGFKNSEELVKLYNQATICVLPSYHEGFSNVGLEVTACERVLICTPLGFSEYIENGKDGIIIPAKDEKALKNAIIDLMENPAKRKRIERNARKKALKYSWDKVAKQYIKLYNEVIKQHAIIKK